MCLSSLMASPAVGLGLLTSDGEMKSSALSKSKMFQKKGSTCDFRINQRTFDMDIDTL